MTNLKVYLGELYKIAVIIVLLLSGTLNIKAQTLNLKSNTTPSERETSIIYKNFADQYDLLIAYTRESYWWENLKDCNVLAFKDGVCLKGYIYSKKNKNGIWSKPKIKLHEVNCDSAKMIQTYLNDAGFYTLNRDTLNINHKEINDKQDAVFSVDDGVNYKFEILTKKDFLIIESYEPEYFLQKIPELRTREEFIKCRDWFLSKYKNL